MSDKKAVLVLEDGTVWKGTGFGAERKVSGEVVFNTGMVGYTEAITDPSYKSQILCQTYPMIGNYGICSSQMESDGPKIQGYIVQQACKIPSHYTCEKTLDSWLKENSIPGIQGVDTRALTKKLRERGVMLGILQVSSGEIDEEALKKEAKNIDDPNDRNLVSEVTVKKCTISGKGPKVVLIDCGAKNNIIHSLEKRGVEVIRVPAYTSAEDILKLKPKGLFISNGPGDPKKCDAVKTVRILLEKDIPTMGICLGNQILALAAGADTYKLKFGHRSQNQPCLEVGTDRCYITSQNHGFSVSEKTLPDGWEPWFRNANDSTNEGIRHRKKPFMSVQFHPEACPGPVDTAFLFDMFVKEVKNAP